MNEGSSDVGRGKATGMPSLMRSVSVPSSVSATTPMS